MNFTFIWWSGCSRIREATRWLITLSLSEITFIFFSEGVYYSFLERARDFMTAIDAKLPNSLVLSSYLLLAINTSGIPLRSWVEMGHQCIALTVYTDLSWNGTPWVKEQIMLISLARFAQYFEMEKIICVFYTPNCFGTMSTKTQRAKFCDVEANIFIFVKLYSPSYYLFCTIRQLNPAKLSTRSILHLCVFMHLKGTLKWRTARERDDVGCVKLDFGYGLGLILSVTGLVQAVWNYILSFLAQGCAIKRRIGRTLCRQQTTTSRLMVLVPRFLFLFIF